MGMLLTPDQIGVRLKAYGIRYAALFDGSTGYLSKMFGTPTDAQKYTYSFWRQRTKLSANQSIVRNGTTSAFIYDGYSGSDEFRVAVEGLPCNGVTTTPLMRDTSAFDHMVVAVDTTRATVSDRVKIYKNGVQITSLSRTNYPSFNATTGLNAAELIHIGYEATEKYNGLMAEFHFIDGQALDPTHFGEMDVKTGNWKAKAFTPGERTIQSKCQVTSGMLSHSGLISFNAAALVDSILTTYNGFHTDSSAAGSYLHVDLGFGNDQAFTQMRFYGDAGNSHGVYDLQYSDDDTTWTTVVSGFNCWVAPYAEATWESAGAHRYWRALKTNGATVGGYTTEVKFYTTEQTAYGANGFHLDFSNGADLGTDVSGGAGAGIGTELLLHCDGADAATTVIDYSLNAYAMTVSDNAHMDTAQSKFGGASLFLDGTSDKVETTNNTAPGSGNFCIECDIRLNGSSTNNTVWSFGENSAPVDGQLRLMVGDGATSNKIIVSTNNTTIIAVGDHATTMSAATWYHVALAREDNTLRLFVDGVKIVEKSFSYTLSDTRGWNIGRDTNAGANWNGWIDNFRVTLGSAVYTCPSSYKMEHMAA